MTPPDRSRILTLNFDHFHNYNKKVKTLIILNSAVIVNVKLIFIAVCNCYLFEQTGV